MLQYSTIKPTLYVETTVISYLVARPSNDASLVHRQHITQQLWEECAHDYEFVVSETRFVTQQVFYLQLFARHLKLLRELK